VYSCTVTQMSKHRGARGGRRARAVSRALSPELFKALSDPNRVALVARLAECGRACTVTEMSACCPVDLSVVSRHLAALRRAGVVEAERRGREVYYSVRAGPLAEALRAMAEAIESCCPGGRGAGEAPGPGPGRRGARRGRRGPRRFTKQRAKRTIEGPAPGAASMEERG
jgi:ArsR family transcriptional regulator